MEETWISCGRHCVHRYWKRQLSIVPLDRHAITCVCRIECDLSEASSIVFLVHIAMEIPLAIQGILAPSSLPFLQLNNTTIVLLKVRQGGDRVIMSVVLFVGLGDVRSVTVVLWTSRYVVSDRGMNCRISSWETRIGYWVVHLP